MKYLMSLWTRQTSKPGKIRTTGYCALIKLTSSFKWSWDSWYYCEIEENHSAVSSLTLLMDKLVFHLMKQTKKHCGGEPVFLLLCMHFASNVTLSRDITRQQWNAHDLYILNFFKKPLFHPSKIWTYEMYILIFCQIYMTVQTTNASNLWHTSIKEVYFFSFYSMARPSLL